MRGKCCIMEIIWFTVCVNFRMNYYISKLCMHVWDQIKPTLSNGDINAPPKMYGVMHRLRPRYCYTFVSFRYYICWPRSPCPQSTIFSLPKCVDIFQKTGASSYTPKYSLIFCIIIFITEVSYIPFPDILNILAS